MAKKTALWPFARSYQTTKQKKNQLGDWFLPSSAGTLSCSTIYLFIRFLSKSETGSTSMLWLILLFFFLSVSSKHIFCIDFACDCDASELIKNNLVLQNYFCQDSDAREAFLLHGIMKFVFFFSYSILLYKTAFELFVKIVGIFSSLLLIHI